MKIACFENDLLKAEIEARRAKRKARPRSSAGQQRAKASQIRPSRNNSKGEFAEWEAQLNAHVQEYLDALEQPRDLPRQCPSRMLAS